MITIVRLFPNEEEFESFVKAQVRPDWSRGRYHGSGSACLDFVGGCLGEPHHPPLAGYLENKPFLPQTSPDFVLAGLAKRLRAALARRQAAALGAGTAEDQAAWVREVARCEKLVRAIQTRSRDWSAAI